jgi:hypothetical protein
VAVEQSRHQGHTAQARSGPACPAANPAAAPRGAGAAGAGKEVKSAKLSSSWAAIRPRRKEIKTRGDTGAAWAAATGAAARVGAAAAMTAIVRTACTQGGTGRSARD